MARPWLVLLLVGCLLLAGCSLPGTGPADGGDGSDGGDGTYPRGWSANGLENATLATRSADSAISGEDFVERRVTVRRVTQSGQNQMLVDVLVVRLDRDTDRLITLRRHYRVSNETAAGVVDSGVSALGDRQAVQISRTFINSTGAYQYRRVRDLQPQVRRLESVDFASATEQDLPAVFANTVPLIQNGTLTNAKVANGTITYDVSNVTVPPFQSGSGRLTLQRSGLVTEFVVNESGQNGPSAFTYELERGDLTVETPAWTANVSDSSPNRPGTTTPRQSESATTSSS